MKNRERKNPNPARKDRTTVERGYFHTGNSGISISLVEESENYDWDVEDRNWYNHYLEIRHSAFGAGTTIRTPIPGPVGCQYYIDAFTRLRDRMLDNPKYRVPSPFESYDPSRGKCDRIVDIMNGMARKEVWSEEIITSQSSTEKRLLGHNLVDPVDGHVYEFVPSMSDYAVGSDGTSNRYAVTDIGKRVSDVVKPYRSEIFESESEDNEPSIESLNAVMEANAKRANAQMGKVLTEKDSKSFVRDSAIIGAKLSDRFDRLPPIEEDDIDTNE